MEQTPKNDNQDSDPKGYLFYARTRIIAGVIAVFAVLWLLNALIGLFEGSETESASKKQGQHTADTHKTEVNTANLSGTGTTHTPAVPTPKITVQPEKKEVTHTPTETDKAHAQEEQKSFLDELGLKADEAKGVTFTRALIHPLEYELKHRWWWWRPNDIINITDNVNNFQVGVLEVTRRTTVILTDRISRTSSTDALDKNLENAMNAFMISADRYWFPSAESKYKEGLEGLNAYAEDLAKGQARFFNRTDNLIPLLRSYVDLLGSCDENLVKFHEADGSKVSHFRADDYFYYAKGVASSLHMILQAVSIDFKEVMETRRAADDMHEALQSLHHAMEIDPLYVTNADLSGILANHRANIAATISHALSYLQVVITALST